MRIECPAATGKSVELNAMFPRRETHSRETRKRIFMIASASALNDTCLRNNEAPCLHSRTATYPWYETEDSRCDGQSYYSHGECNTHIRRQLSSSRNRTARFDDSKSGEQFKAARSAGINSLSKLRASATRFVPFLWRTTVIDEPSSSRNDGVYRTKGRASLSAPHPDRIRRLSTSTIWRVVAYEEKVAPL